MDRLFFILSFSIGSIAIGYAIQVALLRSGAVKRDLLLHISKYFKLTAFFFLHPVAIVGTFWKLSLSDVQLIFFPILGAFSVLMSGAIALMFIRALKIPPKRAASVFTSGMFTNLLTFGGLIGYVLFSDPGYVLAQLFNMFVSICYYLIGYPISNNISQGASSVVRLDLKILKRNPLLFVPISAIAVGLILNTVGVHRPDFYDSLIGVLIPCISALLGVSIGISLRFAKVREYRMEVGLVMLIKFLIVPAVMIPLGLLLGLRTISDGIPFKMLVVLSFMPVAFNALVPPAIFGFDLDLANSAWIVTTASLIVIVPVLYFVLV
jgi:predicted permease